ncbi:MAG: hypothetical protein QOI16_2404 [Pseudonocardiales bacterium]|jgi:hypothetical protein|nr:hypothetical protein [Pseudonocardiales bacterium]
MVVGGWGAHAVAGGEVVDGRGEQVRVLAGGQVPAGEGQDLVFRHTSAGGRDLPVFVGVLDAARDGDRDRAAQLAGDRREVPTARVATVLADEPRRIVQEHCPVPASDDRPQLSAFLQERTVESGVAASSICRRSSSSSANDV